MSKIVRVEVLQVDLKPKVKRTDAIQSFVSQETPIVRIVDRRRRDRHRLQLHDRHRRLFGRGAAARPPAPGLIGRDADEVEQIWQRPVLPHPRDRPSARITALALAAIDTALWDLRCRKAGLPLHVMAGGAQEPHRRSTPPRAAGCTSRRTRWSRMRWREGAAASAAPRSRSAGRMWRGRGAARGRARGGRPRLRDHDRRQPGLHRRRGDPPRARLTSRSTSPGSRSRCRPRISAAHVRLAQLDPLPIAVGELLYTRPFPRVSAARRLLDRAGRRRRASAASRPG